MDRLSLIARLLGGEPSPVVRRAPFPQPSRYPGQRGVLPQDPNPRWVGDTRGRVPEAGLPRRQLPLIRGETPFPVGPGGILPPEPWEGAPAPTFPLAALTGQEPALAADAVTALSPPKRPLPEALSARPMGGPPKRGLEPPSAQSATVTPDLDEEWNAALARVRARQARR